MFISRKTALLVLLIALGADAGGSARAATATFPYIGATAFFSVPDDVFQISAELWSGGNAGTADAIGTAGGFAFGSFASTPGETLSVFVGSGGIAGQGAGQGGDSFVSRAGFFLLLAPGGGSGGAGLLDPSVLGGGIFPGTGQFPAGLASINYAPGVAVAGAQGFGSGNAGLIAFTFVPTAIPEPETYALLLAGLGLLASFARRRESGRRLR